MSDGDIISTIDGALTDWETSDDAMRWTADDAAPSDEDLTAEQIEQIVAAMKVASLAAAQWAEGMTAAMTKFAAQLSAMYPTLREWKP